MVDTGIFSENRFFDLNVEYAKASPEDLLIRLTVTNHGSDPAHLHLLPSLWFRNTWDWGDQTTARPRLRLADGAVVSDPLEELSSYILSCSEQGTWLFTENETNTERLYNQTLRQAYVKDAFHRYLIEDQRDAVNPIGEGSKAVLHLQRDLQPGEVWQVNLRLCRHDHHETSAEDPLESNQVAAVLSQRRQDWEDHLQWVAPDLNAEDRAIHAAAAAGLFWCRKFYNWYVARWLRGDSNAPRPPESRWHSENAYWNTLRARNIISMPDCWEYPYFCQWDLMVHAVAFAEIDPGEAKRQARMLRQASMTANNGQSPAYEWALSDANPPKVVIDYRSHPERTEELIEEIGELGGQAIGVQADVAKLEDLQRLIDTAVKTFGKVDVMVNNAGIETRTSILDTTPEDYDKVMNVNLRGVFFATQFAAKQMIAQGSGGRMINISSVHEDWPMPDNTPYCVAKGGVRMLTRTAGVELASKGVSIVNVGPGAVATPINDSTINNPELLAKLNAAIPMGRMAQPEEIASVVAFLASNGASYMTATSVFADGGIMMSSPGL